MPGIIDDQNHWVGEVKFFSITKTANLKHAPF